MNEDIRSARDLFAKLVDLHPEQRAAALERAAPSDELRREVEALLARDDTGSVLDRPALPTPVRESLSTLVDDPPELDGLRVIDVIGRGGMGTVYRAEQATPRREVAIKVIRPGGDQDAMRRRFEREADALARLQHPNIVGIHECGVLDEAHARPYIVMELIEGRPLQEWTRAERPSYATIARILIDVAHGVHHAHLNGIVHRDLKPDNIVIDGRGAPRVLDFGVARIVEEEETAPRDTRKGERIGTPSYMSPEQLADDQKRLDARTDVYSLGVIAYELLCGDLPHDLEDTTIDEAIRLRRTPPAPLGRHHTKLRGDLEAVVDRALAPNPDERYQSAEAFAADLERHRSGEPVQARPLTATYMLGRLARRHRGAAASIVFALVMVIVAIIGTSLGLIEANRQADRAGSSMDALIAAFEALDVTELGESRTLGAFVEELAAARGRLAPEDEARLDMLLSRAQHTLGEFEPSMAAARRAWQYYEAELGFESDETLDAVGLVIEGHLELGEPNEAIALIDRVVPARERLAVGGDAETQESLRDARVLEGLKYMTLQDAVNCERILREVVDGDPDGIEGGDKLTIEAAAILANVLMRKTGGRSEAIELLESARASCREHVGPVHEMTIMVTKTLTSALKGIDDQRALDILLQTIDLCDAVYGGHHLRTSQLRASVPAVLTRLERADEATPAFLNAIAGFEETGPDSIDLALVLSQYAMHLINSVKTPDAQMEAEGRMDKALEIMRAAGLDDLYLTVAFEINRATVDVTQREYDIALPELERLLPRAQQLAPGSEVRCRGQLAVCYRETGQFERARAILDEIIPSLHEPDLSDIKELRDSIDAAEEAARETDEP